MACPQSCQSLEGSSANMLFALAAVASVIVTVAARNLNLAVTIALQLPIVFLKKGKGLIKHLEMATMEIAAHGCFLIIEIEFYKKSWFNLLKIRRNAYFSVYNCCSVRASGGIPACKIIGESPGSNGYG